MSRPQVGTLIPVGAVGDAQKEHVLEDKIFSSQEEGVGVEGTMPNRGAQIITPGTSNKIIPAGYHNGSGYVKGDADLIAGNIRKGKNIFGVSGSLLPASSQIIVGTTSMSSTTEEVSIPDMESTKSFLLFNWYMDSTTDADAVDRDFANIAVKGSCLSSSIKFYRGYSGSTVRIAYYVITLPNITVQHGSGTIKYSKKSTSITIPSVDVDKSVVIVSGALKSTSSSATLTRKYLQAYFVRAYLESSTTLRVERDVTFTSDYDFYYQVITFD